MSTNNCKRYYGKYRGTVVNNVDPEMRGRIQARVLDVSNLTPTTWAMPSFPVAGTKSGIYSVPVAGSGVWIEFENGDPDYPVWTGCFCGSTADVPNLEQKTPPAVPSITFETPLQNGITLSDMPGPSGGVRLSREGGLQAIEMNDTGITIRAGTASIQLTATGQVIINNGALTIQ